MEPNPAPAVNPQVSAASFLPALLAQIGTLKGGFRTSEFYVTLSGILTAAASAWLGKLPPEWAAALTAIAAICYHMIRACSKSAHQAGLLAALDAMLGNVGALAAPVPPVAAQPPAPLPQVGIPVNAASDGGSLPRTAGFITPGLCVIAAAFAALVIALASLAGCAALKAAQAKPWVQAVEKDAGKAVLSFVAGEFTGAHVDSAWAISTGLNTISDAVKALPNPQAAQLVEETAIAFSGASDAQVKSVATQLAQTFGAANPITPADRSAAVVALATGVASALTK